MISSYLQLSLGSEIALNTPVAGANDTAIGANTPRFTFFTMPTTHPVYFVTAIEWLNGTVINGNVNSAVWTVDANPPTDAANTLLAWAAFIAQAGASAVQKRSIVSSLPIPGGTIVGAFIATGSATGRYGTTTVASANNSKALTVSSDQATGNATAWSATTEEPYIKVYGKPLLKG